MPEVMPEVMPKDIAEVIDREDYCKCDGCLNAWASYFDARDGTNNA